jgi:hypothetical protein
LAKLDTKFAKESGLPIHRAKLTIISARSFLRSSAAPLDRQSTVKRKLKMVSKPLLIAEFGERVFQHIDKEQEDLVSLLNFVNEKKYPRRTLLLIVVATPGPVRVLLELALYAVGVACIWVVLPNWLAVVATVIVLANEVALLGRIHDEQHRGQASHHY